MKVYSFDTGVVPVQKRFATFQEGAVEFDVRAVGDPAAFSARWRVLRLGDLNLIHSHSTALHYRRDAERITSDGEDRFSLHYYIRGGETGTIDGRHVAIDQGSAMIWDLTLPLDLRSRDHDNEMIIVTLPRHLILEVLPAASIAGPVAPGPELAMAIEQARYFIDNAEDLPEASGVYLGRALRDMVAVTLLPAHRILSLANDPDAPMLRRIIDVIDGRLSEELGTEEIAHALGAEADRVATVVDNLGGLPHLVERRRLMAAYMLLCNPVETDTVKEIAHRCGFSSLPTFSRRFRSVFYSSARDLRRLGRGQLPVWAGAYHVDRLYDRMIVSEG